MPQSVVSIHQGGQNSVMGGLIYGVPQIVVPGQHFERSFNADSVVRLGAGIRLEPGQFTPERLASAVQEIISDDSYRQNARQAGKTLVKLGGAKAVIDAAERLSKGWRPAIAC